MDIFHFPPGKLKASEMVRHLAHELKGEYSIELRQFDAVINGNVEMDVRESRKRLVVRLALANQANIYRQVDIEDWSVNLDALRGKIRALMQIAKDKGLLIQLPVQLEGAPPHLFRRAFQCKRCCDRLAR